MTEHSINFKEAEFVINSIPSDAEVFVDYGCHMGHLSFQIALLRKIKVIAVDNFIGSPEMIKKYSPGFRDTFDSNMATVQDDFVGEVEVVHTDDFWKLDLRGKIDMAFIDSAHDYQSMHEFADMGRFIKPGGILSGHDYDFRYVKEPVKKLAELDEWDDSRLRLPGQGSVFFLTKK